MPFEGSGEGRRLASALTGMFRERISGTGKFKLVDPFAYKPGEGVADAVFTGAVASYEAWDSSRVETRARKGGEGKTVQYQVTVYERRVSIEFTYRLIRDRDGVAIGERTISCAMTDSKENRSDLRSSDAMARSVAEGGLVGFAREIATWMSQEKLTLDKEASKDKALKVRMKEAGALVKAGNLKAARDAYARIYAETNSLAAGIIAAFPAGSRVSLLNISTSAKDRVDVVIREITATLMSGGVIVLDRENLDAINAEKRYQASGEVGDDSYVDVGRMLGVESIVTFSIAGSGGQRKLAIKAVSVETGEVLYNALTEI
ncbi:MAG: CsgG/HfaB family protein [Treponema sp.]|jgi:hypothetical protein|nr:CsgG/HfaB family protein [Treponema sp.]